MSSNATIGVETRATNRERELRDTYADGAIPGLPNHLVVAHILRSEYFDYPADLARLTAVSRAMLDAVVATGLEFEELEERKAVELECLSAVQRRQRRGHLLRQERLYEAASRGGHLEELKVLRENDIPWNEETCGAAAAGGQLEVLQCAHTNGCPWDGGTCTWAAICGHLEMLKWARANGCPWKVHTLIWARARGHLELLN